MSLQRKSGEVVDDAARLSKSAFIPLITATLLLSSRTLRPMTLRSATRGVGVRRRSGSWRFVAAGLVVITISPSWMARQKSWQVCAQRRREAHCNEAANTRDRPHFVRLL